MSTEQPQDGGHKKPPIPTPAKKVPAYNIEKRGDRLYQAQYLHKWFAISSLLLFVITIGMVMQDYSREWKQYQREFNRLAVDSTVEDYLGEFSAIDKAKYQQLQAQYETAKQSEEQNRSQIAEAEEKVGALNAQHIRVDQLYKSTKAQEDADKYAYEEAKANKLSSEEKRKAKYEETAALTTQYFLEREVIATNLAAARDELNKLRETTDKSMKDALAMRAELDRLGRQINTLNPGRLVTAIINAPLMDFMRPSLQVKQILLPNLYYDQPFMRIARVDRCTTCHLGIDNRKFEEAPQPFRTHPKMDLFLGANSPHPIDRIGCTSCHGGLDRATDFITAGHTPKDEMQTEDWAFEYGWDLHAPVRHYLETPMLPMDKIEAGCYKCHNENGSTSIPGAASLEQGRDLIRQLGCFGCHRIPGYEGNGKVGPDLSTVSGKLTRQWVEKWLANPKEFKSEARMPKFWYNSNNSGVSNGIDWDKRNPTEINAIVDYLWSKSTARTLPAANTNGNATRGKEIVETVGCFGCHAVGPIEEDPTKSQIKRRHGYNLANQGSKVTANWIANWVKNPRHVWPETKMPNLRLTDTEAADVTAYLSSLKNPEWEAKTPPPSDPAMLDSIVLEFMRATSTKAKAEADLAKMTPEQKSLYAGEKLVGRYACYACHNVPGFENAQQIGTELTEAGTKILSQLDFGFLHIEHTRDAWYTQKLTDPRIFDVGRSKRPEELLVMPNFGLSQKDVQSIVMVLNSMVKDRVNLEMKERTSPAVAAGRMLIAEKNCKGCHIIEKLGGDIRVHLKDKDREWPPDLNTQGQKTEPEWLRSFLKDPTFEKPRWWITTRMPTFDFTEREISILGKYFAELDKLVDWPYNNLEVETTPQMLAAGKQLFTGAQCHTCHPSTPGGNNETRAGVAPNLTLTHGRLRPDWTERWLTNPQAIDPNSRMPAFFMVDGKLQPFVPTEGPTILNSDAEAQIRALRDYVFSLGGPVKTAP